MPAKKVKSTMEEQLSIYRSMIDFGLVILIWLVQLIIYPAFEFSHRSSFPDWHRKYMWLITLFVAPLMFAQLAFIIYQVYAFRNIMSVISLVLAIFVWVHTFLRAVPVHNKLSTDGNTKLLVLKLVRVNWLRTVIWTMIWILGLLLW
ncbi:MAG: hypothetical protein P8X57_01445 [Cyclobacteriaceae bacterium]